MARRKTYTSRATIIKLPDHTPGLLFAASGQVPFRIEQVWKSARAPAVNMVVELETDSAGVPVGIWVVDSGHERRQKPEAWGRQASAGSGLLPLRMDKVTLGATVFLWLAWFSLPVVRLDVGFLAKSITFWELISVDFRNFDLAGHGVFRLLGLICLVAPLAAPFWQSAVARLLYCLPLTFLSVAAQRVVASLPTADGNGKDTRTWFSFEVGAYVLLVTGIVIALRAFKPGKQF